MEANPQRFFFVANLQDSSVSAQLERERERGRQPTIAGRFGHSAISKVGEWGRRKVTMMKVKRFGGEFRSGGCGEGYGEGEVMFSKVL